MAGFTDEPGTSGGTDVLEKVETVEPGDHELMSHYAKKEDIMRAMVEGVPCRALCGKYWIPTKDPEKYPVCKTCEEILNTVFPQT